MNKKLKQKFQQVKAVVFDVDGVLTDGRLIYGQNGDELKFFHSRDGLGIILLKPAGLKTAIITGRTSKQVEHRSRELKIDFVKQGAIKKLSVLSEAEEALGVSRENLLYIGDDINDLQVMKYVGMSAAPADCEDVVRKRVDFVSKKRGGMGAVRDIIDRLLKAQGIYREAIKKFFGEELIK